MYLLSLPATDPWMDGQLGTKLNEHSLFLAVYVMQFNLHSYGQSLVVYVCELVSAMQLNYVTLYVNAVSTCEFYFNFSLVVNIGAHKGFI